MTARVSQFGLQNESRKWGLATQQVNIATGHYSCRWNSIGGRTKCFRVHKSFKVFVRDVMQGRLGLIWAYAT